MYEQNPKLFCTVNSYLRIPVMFYIYTDQQLASAGHLKFQKDVKK